MNINSKETAIGAVAFLYGKYKYRCNAISGYLANPLASEKPTEACLESDSEDSVR